ncbi:hypothetical protein [Actinoplanes auranticolor]|uniref:hypothetical protein n=1 Tax=Actinoplanes auranticolor TaxID=47988 RepID=UPI001BB2FF00|nr:hypothetical protein [Actinoplanes auranticolor]
MARRTLISQAGGRDLAELRPDRVHVGGAGVFSGDWMRTYPDDGPDCLRMGFVGTLIDRWNGWEVFSCTRPVADAIVAEQQAPARHHGGRPTHHVRRPAGDPVDRPRCRRPVCGDGLELVLGSGRPLSV